jgi:hypothetical protein
MNEGLVCVAYRLLRVPINGDIQRAARLEACAGKIKAQERDLPAKIGLLVVTCCARLSRR